jgi:hypothetical protein
VKVTKAFTHGVRNPYDIANWCFPRHPFRTVLFNTLMKSGRLVGRLPRALNTVRSFDYSGWKPKTIKGNNSPFDSWGGWVEWDESLPPAGVLICVRARWKVNDTTKSQRGLPMALDSVYNGCYAEEFDGWLDSHILWWKLTAIGREQLTSLADAKKRAGIE